MIVAETEEELESVQDICTAAAEVIAEEDKKDIASQLLDGVFEKGEHGCVCACVGR